ncbi:MAG: hypothetical protein J6R20_09440, partial [Clostridia bacterium]|nr:hypothetical protein [Clostridia bacterium]
ISRKEAIGTWSGSYEYDGNSFSATFVLEEDGDYAYLSYKNGSYNKTEGGTWECKGGKVILHEEGNRNISSEYTYKDNALVNNDHYFYKSN